MSEESRELIELRKEVVEARNQAIKTDHQVKNLSLDVKGFEKRFDALERRTRIASVGAHMIVAVTIAVATYMIHTVRVKSLTSELTTKVAETEQQRREADKLMQDARQRLATLEQERTRREKSGAVAKKLVEHLDNKRDKEAVELLESLDISVLTSLESKLLEKRLGDLRTSTAEAAYKAGKAAVDQKRADVAIQNLRKNLSLDPEGKYAPNARYLLATQLWSQKRYDEAEPAFRDILAKDNEKAVLDEVRYLLAGTLASLGRREEAKTAFNEIVLRGGRYATSAKDQIRILDSSGGSPAPVQATAAAATTKPEVASSAPAAAPAVAPAQP